MASEARAGDAVPGTKLRNSCDACATAKIKCTQEKSVCTYCAKRSKVCVYSASKRVRRSTRANMNESRENSVSKTTTATMATATTSWPSPGQTPALEPSGSYSSLSSMASTDFTSSQASSLTTPLPSQDWPDIFATLTLPATTTSPTEHTTSADWASLGSSIDPFTYLDYPAFDFSTPLSSFEQNNPLNGEKVVNPTIFSDNATTSTNNNTISSFTKSNGSLTKDNPPFPTGTQTGTRFSSSSSSPLNRHNSTTFSLVPPCRCLMRTLGFLAQLSMDSSKAGIASENGNALTHQPNVTHVYAQIDNISAEIGKVLQCACSNNADLLVLLLLVISKIQVWYAAAVNAVTSHDNDSEAVDGADSNPTSVHPRILLPSLETNLACDESEGEDQRRIFMQNVLSRLKGLQMIVTRLSQRSANVEADTFPSITLMAGAQGPLHSDIKGKISVLPFSAIILRALCSELRDRLSGLSRSIAEQLRVS